MEDYIEWAMAELGDETARMKLTETCAGHESFPFRMTAARNERIKKKNPTKWRAVSLTQCHGDTHITHIVSVELLYSSPFRTLGRTLLTNKQKLMGEQSFTCLGVFEQCHLPLMVCVWYSWCYLPVVCLFASAHCSLFATCVCFGADLYNDH